MYYKSCSSHWRAVCTYMLQPPQQTALQHLVKFTSAEQKKWAYLCCYARNRFSGCSHKEEYLPESGPAGAHCSFTWLKKPSEMITQITVNPQVTQNSVLKKKIQKRIAVNNWKWRKTKPCADGSTWNSFHALKYLGFKMTHKT